MVFLHVFYVFFGYIYVNATDIDRYSSLEFHVVECHYAVNF